MVVTDRFHCNIVCAGPLSVQTMTKCSLNYECQYISELLDTYQSTALVRRPEYSGITHGCSFGSFVAPSSNNWFTCYSESWLWFQKDIQILHDDIVIIFYKNIEMHSPGSCWWWIITCSGKDVDVLVQDCSISSPLEMEILQSGIKLSTCCWQQSITWSGEDQFYIISCHI